MKHLGAEGQRQFFAEVLAAGAEGYKLPEGKVTLDNLSSTKAYRGKAVCVVVKDTGSVPAPKGSSSEGDIEALKAKYKELTGKGTAIKDAVKLQAKIDELEASKA